MLRAQWAGSPRVVPTESLTYKSPYKELFDVITREPPPVIDLKVLFPTKIKRHFRERD
jgi:hypothetical protein